MSLPLTPRQQEAFDFVKRYTQECGYAPSCREVMKHLGLASPSAAHKLLGHLKTKGVLTSARQQPRSWSIPLPTRGDALVRLPLVGTFELGKPIQMHNVHTHFSLPCGLVPHPERSYLLKIQGNGLADDYLIDSDWIVLQAQETAQPGQLILGSIEGIETVIRYYQPCPPYVRLEAVNTHLAPLIVKEKSLQILGILLASFRSYQPTRC